MQVITEKKNKMMTPSVADPEKQCFGSGAGAENFKNGRLRQP